MSRIASSSSEGRRRVSPVTSPTARPAGAGGSPRPAASRSRARTRSLDRPSGPGGAAGRQVTGSSRTPAWRRARYAPKPRSSSGRAVTVPVQREPSTGGSSRPRSNARSRVLAPSTAVTRTTVHHPRSAGRGSVTTVARTSAVPPVRARSASGPRWTRSTRAAAAAPRTSTTATVARRVDRRATAPVARTAPATSPTPHPSVDVPTCHPRIAPSTPTAAHTGRGPTSPTGIRPLTAR